MSDIAKLALAVAHGIAEDVKLLLEDNNGATDNLIGLYDVLHEGPSANLFIEDNPIHRALLEKSTTLANSYAQVKRDIDDETRISWAGTAHEVREILSTLLRMLAPDTEVTKQDWYKQEPKTNGPTQKQRVQYILESQGAGSKEQEVVEQVEKLNYMIGDLIRATYSRASVAAHQYRPKKEVSRILRYFEAFAHDLLSID